MMNRLLSIWNRMTTAFNHLQSGEDEPGHYFVRKMSQAEAIVKDNISLMMLTGDCKNRPEMLLINDTGTFHFPLWEGFQVHICNEFLRSLDTDLDIEFVTYKQYGNLIKDCFAKIGR